MFKFKLRIQAKVVYFMKKYLLFPSVFCFIMSQTICQELLPMQSLDLDLLLSKQIESKEATSPSNKFYSSNFNLPKSNQASFLSITFSFDKVLKTPGSEISLKLWDTSEGEIEIIPLTFDNHELKDPDQVIFTNPAYI